MKITVIGCGNAFSDLNHNQSFLVEEDGRRMLIDCGYSVPHALTKRGVDVKSIDDIYVSHLHADHIGGLENIAFRRYDWYNKPQHYSQGSYAPRLIGNDQLLTDLWEKSLRGGMESMEGFVSNIETFFEPVRIQPNKIFDWQGWKIQLIQQIHIMTGSTISLTFGLFFTRQGHQTVYFTTDAQHCSPKQVERFYKEADMIFQDCECIGVDTVKKEMLFNSGVHANYAQLAGWKSANSIVLSDDIKAKMYLSHYQDFVIHRKDFFGNDCNWCDLSESDGFGGFVSEGMTLEV